MLPEPVLHVAAHGGQEGDIGKATPVDPVAAHVVVGIPDERRTISHAAQMQHVRGPAERLRGLPLLALDDDLLSGEQQRGHQRVGDVMGHHLCEVVVLTLFALVAAERVILADPLAEAVEYQPTIFPALLARGIRVADEVEVGLVSCPCEGLGESGDTGAEPSRHGVPIRPFEGQEYEGRVVRRDREQVPYLRYHRHTSNEDSAWWRARRDTPDPPRQTHWLDSVRDYRQATRVGKAKGGELA